MAYYPNEIVEQIEDRVRVFYVNRERCRTWNATRRDGELRILTGWTWIEKKGQRRVRGGFKTRSVALRDAYYTVLQGLETAPGQDRATVLRAAPEKVAA